MASRTLPLVLYGTAWKEDTTATLTETAINNGFTGIDTANYPTAYDESLTGEGIAAAIKGGVKRSDLFIQTKYMPIYGHAADKIPFNPDQSIEDQIRESVKQSLEHLQVDYIDVLFLHVFFQDDADTLAGWKVFESFVPHTIRALGVSNFDLPKLKLVYEAATVKPEFVQNRFYKETGFDSDLRDFCAENGITYQAYWMLTHSPEVMESTLLASVAEKLGVEKELAFYILILGLGGTQVLNGTKKSERMIQDLKTITKLFADEGAMKGLQPDVEEFRKLLKGLSG